MSELRIVTGRSGSGKTSFIFNEMKKRVDAGETGLILLVPDQFSHEAERLLCESCGDRASLCAEVLSFPRLYFRLVSELGGAAREYIDRAGKLLVMRRAAALADSMNGTSPLIHGKRITFCLSLIQPQTARARGSVPSVCMRFPTAPRER